MTLDEIRDEFPGYHVEINLYPSGGDIHVTGCEFCDTNEDVMEDARWRIHRGQTIADAVKCVKSKLPEVPDGAGMLRSIGVRTED